MNILETLSKFSHDADNEVACNSILAMGIVGAGAYVLFYGGLLGPVVL